MPWNNRAPTRQAGRAREAAPRRRTRPRREETANALLRLISRIEQAALAALRHRQPQMGIATTVEAPPSCRARDEAELNEIRFDHVLDRIARLAEPRGQRLHADRSSA